MKCFNHPATDAVGVCAQCGRFGCTTCLTDVGNALLCTWTAKGISARRCACAIGRARQRNEADGDGTHAARPVFALHARHGRISLYFPPIMR